MIKPLKYITLALALTTLLAGCGSPGKTATTAYRYGSWGQAAENDGPNQGLVNDVMKTAFSQVGNRYRYGGSSPETGFDCSGFVGWVYRQFDVDLPRTSGSMLSMGEAVPRDELRPGDLVFFGKRRVSHVGIYTGDDKFIHSPSSGKAIQENSLSNNGRGERYMGARRVIDNEGVVSISESLKAAWAEEARQMVMKRPLPSPTKTAKNYAKKTSKKGAAVKKSARGKKAAAAKSKARKTAPKAKKTVKKKK